MNGPTIFHTLLEASSALDLISVIASRIPKGFLNTEVPQTKEVAPAAAQIYALKTIK